MMAASHHLIYECENPNCGLRFPGYEGIPKRILCPACRSSIKSVAAVEYFTEKNHSDVFERKSQFHALLDNIRSAWNVGSIYRTADGMGINKIYLCGITPTPDNTKVQKTALGAEINIPWEKSLNSVKTCKYLKSLGYLLWTLEDTPDAEPLYQVDIPDVESTFVLIVGNEVTGVDPGIIEICDKVISIPMRGEKRSYNVAIAFSIAASILHYRQSVSHGSRKILPST